MRVIRKLMRILNGEYCVDISPRTSAVFLALAGVHVLLLLMFLQMGAWLMVGVNVLSVLLYLICSLKRFDRNYVMLGIVLCIEVMSHMLLSVVAIGWDSAFYLYVVALVPAAYMFAYDARVAQKRRMNVGVIVIAVILVFLLMRTISFYWEPLYEVSKIDAFQLSIINSFAAFGIITYIMTVFASAVNNSEYVLRAKNRQLNTLANTDPLTELYNRRGMQKRLERAIYDAEEGGTTFCLILADIDDFKRLNDTYGHECGDFILVKIAEAIRGQIRDNDFICRWGGEEILILLNNCRETMAVDIAEKLRAMIENYTIIYRESEVHFTMTFGVQEYLNCYRAEELIRLVDMKLYFGKQHGKNQVVANMESEKSEDA